MNTLNKYTLYFILFVIFFSLDACLNYFYPIPVYVIFLLLITPVYFIPGVLKVSSLSKLLIVSLVFGIAYVLGLLFYGYHKEGLSDFLYILSFFASILFFGDNFTSFKSYNHNIFISLFLIVCILLFVTTFFGFDKNVWGNTIGVESSDIEYNRAYRQGLFRKAHIAAYFFLFLSLYYLNRLSLSHKLFNVKLISIIVILIMLLLLTGSRTPLVTVLLALGFYYFRLKHLKYFVGIILLGLLVYVKLGYFLTVFSGTILYQYLTLFKTMTDNFSRLSRFMIWNSWWSEVQLFNIGQFIFGNTFYNSIEANYRNLGLNIWFHNDFLSIFYSYGIIALILYISAYYSIYRRHKVCIKNNIYIYITFSSCWLSAFFNGFYYYYTPILLFVFYAMLRDTYTKKI